MAYKTHWEEKGIFWVFSGVLKNDDLISCNKEVYEYPEFKNIEYEICDFNAVDSFPVDASTIRMVAEMDAKAYKINPGIKVAIVASQDIMKGLTKMYSVYFEMAGNNTSWETEVFVTIEEARKWINV
jgi:hypothetical protein